MLVSPCTLCPPWFRPPLAGCAAGVKFLLLHLPLTTTTECSEHSSLHETVCCKHILFDLRRVDGAVVDEDEILQFLRIL